MASEPDQGAPRRCPEWECSQCSPSQLRACCPGWASSQWSGCRSWGSPSARPSLQRSHTFLLTSTLQTQQRARARVLSLKCATCMPTRSEYAQSSSGELRLERRQVAECLHNGAVQRLGHSRVVGRVALHCGRPEILRWHTAPELCSLRRAGLAQQDGIFWCLGLSQAIIPIWHGGRQLFECSQGQSPTSQAWKHPAPRGELICVTCLAVDVMVEYASSSVADRLARCGVARQLCRAQQPNNLGNGVCLRAARTLAIVNWAKSSTETRRLSSTRIVPGR